MVGACDLDAFSALPTSHWRFSVQLIVELCVDPQLPEEKLEDVAGEKDIWNALLTP